jgi:regulator of protease activity HflC (stomatin/prohibitin superfamily)
MTLRYIVSKLTHSFGKEFTTAVEQKQIAQQDAERAKFVVEKAEQERQAAVIRAEGEAEAANTISKALNRAGDAFVQFRKIEAAREIGESHSILLCLWIIPLSPDLASRVFFVAVLFISPSPP